MKEKTIAYCRAGENCSLALLRAASDQYGFPLPKELIDSCGAVCSGFGIGGICSALVAAIMVLGILFEPEEAKEASVFPAGFSGEIWRHGLSDPFGRQAGLHRIDGGDWRIVGRNRWRRGYFEKKPVKMDVFWKNPCT